MKKQGLKIISAALAAILLCSCAAKQGANSLIYEKGKIPDAYREKCEESGTLHEFSYDTADYAGTGEKTEKGAVVYTPYGYDKSERYNILYIMHGAGGSQHTYMGSAEDTRDFKYIVDNLVMNGDIEPLIVVMPTIGESDSGEYFSGIQSFITEIRCDLIPAVESEYSTYAENTDSSGIGQSRTHRAFAGFSMGGYIAWNTFENDLDYFAWFAPMSCYYYDTNSSDREADSDGGAALLASAVTEGGYTSNDFHIFTASGSEDFLHEETKEIVDSLCGYSDIFKYTDTPFSDGNITYYLGEGGEHSFKSSLEYLYNALPEFYK